MAFKIFFRDHEDSATGRPIPVNLELVILTEDIDCEWCGDKITNMLAAKITDNDGFVEEFAHVSHLDSPDVKIDDIEDIG